MAASQGDLDLSLVDHNILKDILSLVAEKRDRDACSQTCKAFMQADRHTRHHVQLRCTRGMLSSIPTCFQNVTQLDISRVVPRCNRPLFVSDILAQLARSFPSVEKLTMYNDYALAGTGVQLLLKVWPSLKELTILNPSPDTLRTGSINLSLADAMETLPLVSKGLPLVLVMDPGGAAQTQSGELMMHLKEVNLSENTSCLGLHRLAALQPPHLDTLAVVVNDRRQLERGSCCLNALSRFTTLRTLHVEAAYLKDDERYAFCEKSLMAQMKALPLLESFSVALKAYSQLRLFPCVHSAVERLHTLSIRLVNEGYQGISISFSEIAGYTSLTRLELPGWSSGYRDAEEVVKICASCPKLEALTLPSLTEYQPKPRQLPFLDLKPLFLAMAAAGARFEELGVAHIVEQGPSKDLLSVFQPFSATLRKLDCGKLVFVPSVGVFKGWQGLEELTLKWDPSLRKDATKSSILFDCPSLRKLRLSCRPGTDISFSEATRGITSFALTIEVAKRRATSDPASFFSSIVSKLRKDLPGLTDLSVSIERGDHHRGDENHSPWHDGAALEMLATYPALCQLSLSGGDWPQDQDQLDAFNQNICQLLRCPTLLSVTVPAAYEHVLEQSFYEELFLRTGA